MKLIIAVGVAGEFGAKGQMPWGKIPEDMAYFKQQTEGQTVVMGMDTYYSLPPRFRPLPNRRSLVLGSGWRGEQVADPNVELLPSFFMLEGYLEYEGSAMIGEVWVIGGKRPAEWAIQHERATELHITHIHANFATADVLIDLSLIEQNGWKEVSRVDFGAGDFIPGQGGYHRSIYKRDGQEQVVHGVRTKSAAGGHRGASGDGPAQAQGL